jgi:serine/threonine protein kinase
MPNPAPITQPPRFVPFGKYLLLERIAIGGMAEVYLAKSFESGRPSDLLAIKRILPTLAADDEFIRMFLDEAKIAGGLSHPGIVQIRELGRIATSHYLAMDFVWGKDLLAVARRCRSLGTQLSPAFVAWVGANLCDALAYAHEKRDRHGKPMQIIHRDVSPQNVLVSFDGKVKVIDFGIAKAQSRTTHTQSGVLKGKVGYMSPEQVQGLSIDHRADLFAVGTCLYELLTLKSLFARENSFEALENVREAKARPIRELRKDVAPVFEEILKRALAVHREDRWQSARELARALYAFVAEVEPTFERRTAVQWLRDAFRKEFHQERVRLDGFDQIGRPQISPAEEQRRNSTTSLEISAVIAPPPPDWDEDVGETLVHDHPMPFVDSKPDDEGPAEVFFRHTEPNLAVPDMDIRTQDDPPSPIDHETSLDMPLTASDAGDLALEPAQINSGVIRQLLPPTEEEARRASSSLEPTSRQRPIPKSKAASVAPSEKKKRSFWLPLLAGFTLLAAGAISAWLWLLYGARASIEVRTTPSIEAMVLLDGAHSGTAPVRLENVAPGHHVITILADGYEDSIREVDVGPNGVAMVDVILTPRGPDPPRQ